MTRKLHKYLIRLLALVALSVALFMFIEPKILIYNQKVAQQQSELMYKAEGRKGPSFSCSTCGIEHLLQFAHWGTILLFLSFAGSLLLTKKIIFSSFFTALYFSQFILLLESSFFEEALYQRYLSTESIYAPIYALAFLALMVSEILVIRQLCRRIFQPVVIFK